MLALACFSLATAASAAAKPGFYASKPFHTISVQLGTSNGYRIEISSWGRDRISLDAFKREVSARYTVPGRADASGIHARFGSFGRASLKFVPVGPPKVEGNAGPSCKGKEATLQRGTFVGSVRFRGEGGFIRVRKQRARGSIYRSFRLVCRVTHHPHRLPSPRLQHGFSLGAIPAAAGGAPWFSVYKEHPRESSHIHWSSEEANYLASSSEARGRLRIDRSASAIAAPETFAVEPLEGEPSLATVLPPAPFSGSAHFERAPDGNSTWTGDLEVELPGLGTVPLAGSGYTAKLCKGIECACPVGKCVFFVVGTEGRAQPVRRRLARSAP
jgi:hypothetical protein